MLKEKKEKTKKTKFALIISQFPETHETFILREIIEIKNNKIDFSIFSLKKCKDKIIHPQAKELMKETFYSPFFFSWNIIKANFYFIFKTPFKILTILFYIIKHNYQSLELLVKSLVIFPKTLYYANTFQNKGVDHIHAHWATIPTTSAIIISRLTGIPFSFTAHAWDIFLPNPMLQEKVRRAEFVVTCTGYNKKYLDSLLDYKENDKIILNYHGIDFDTLPEINKDFDDNLILSIGRLCEQKGFPYLIDACSILRDKGHQFKCVIVGEGPDRKSLTSQINQLGLQEYVVLSGMKPQSYIFDMFNKARMFVLPCVISRNGDRDGIPNVMIEALALNTPVISTTVSGIPEIIYNNITGITVDPKNSRQLAEAIIGLLNNPAAAETFVKNGRNLVEEKFDIKKNVGVLVSILINRDC